jgi:hypothetical protein
MATPVGDSVPLVGDYSSIENKFIDGLTQGGSWQFAGASILTYSLHHAINLNNDLFGAMSNAFVVAVNQALSAWANVANISFQQISTTTNLLNSTADLAICTTGAQLQMVGAIGFGIFPDPVVADEILLEAGETCAHYPRIEGAKSESMQSYFRFFFWFR